MAEGPQKVARIKELYKEAGISPALDVAREAHGVKGPNKTTDVVDQDKTKEIEPPEKEVGKAPSTEAINTLLAPSDKDKPATVESFLQALPAHWNELSADPEKMKYILNRLAKENPSIGGVGNLRKKLGYMHRGLAYKYGAPEGFEFVGQQPGSAMANISGYKGPGLDLPAPNVPWGKGWEWSWPSWQRGFTTKGTEETEQGQLERLTAAVRALEGMK